MLLLVGHDSLWGVFWAFLMKGGLEQLMLFCVFKQMNEGLVCQALAQQVMMEMIDVLCSEDSRLPLLKFVGLCKVLDVDDA